MQIYLYDVYTSAKGRGIWEIKAVSRLSGDTYVTDTRDSISIDNYKSEEAARNREGYRALLYYALRDNGKEVVSYATMGINRALIECKAYPDKLPYSSTYGDLLRAFIWYAYGGDIAAEGEARNILGNKTGKEIIEAFSEVAPEVVEAITPEDVAAYVANIEAGVRAYIRDTSFTVRESDTTFNIVEKKSGIGIRFTKGEYYSPYDMYKGVIVPNGEATPNEIEIALANIEAYLSDTRPEVLGEEYRDYFAPTPEGIAAYYCKPSVAQKKGYYATKAEALKAASRKG